MKSLARRLDRLEAHTAPGCRGYPLLIRYVGDPASAQAERWTLTVWVHRDGCDTPEHNGPCTLKQACHDALV